MRCAYIIKLFLFSLCFVLLNYFDSENICQFDDSERERIAEKHNYVLSDSIHHAIVDLNGSNVFFFVCISAFITQ